MFNPSSMTVGELAGSVRDISFALGVIIFGWKARSWFQPLVDSFKKLNEHLERSAEHMTKMEYSMELLLSNHLQHIELYLQNLSDHK